MKWFGIPWMCRFLKSERGQGSMFAIFTASITMAMGGASIETGHVYYAYQRLVASTNAATLAGAQAMPSTTQASNNVTLYSSQAGQLNEHPMLKNATASATFLCLNTVANKLNVPCTTATGGSGGYNALKVTQTANVPLWFGGLLGMSSMNMSATATAAMRGGTNSPWNIAILLDTTGSMGSRDSGLQCSGTRESCAQQGIQILLNDLYPCALGDNCPTSTNPVDSVSLFVFPAVTTATASKDYVCKTSNPTIVAYTFPDTLPGYVPGSAPGSNLLLPSGDTYQVIGFSNNYKLNDAATSLNKNAALVIASGGSGVTGCSGVQTPGGVNTYYAQVIYTAQATLAAEQAANPGSKNAMIILTDGDATACAAGAYTTGGACSTGANLTATEGKLNGTGSKTTNPSGYNNPTYPSALGECGQAVLAAQYAANAGTTVYTIGYGTPTSGSCLSDRYYSASVTTGGGTWGPGKQACQAMAAMASSQVNFYSDAGGGCQATAPSNQALTKLTAIFRAIINNLTSPRLVPNGTT
jgi:Putative Tad-like Flp pilus-assembly